ncbi:MAG: hypothetical protein CTY20_07295 [Hyphomicrobium sp.]|nr:MAG: hypothetical protein CTY20_07295 [Hyphomicrobium sp.]
MSLIADILFLAVILGLFILIFFRILGRPGRRRNRGTRSSDGDAGADDAVAGPHHGRTRGGSGGGYGAGEGQGGDGGGD